MRLFLASEAKHPECMQKMERYVGGFTGKKIAYIPTAANGENTFGEWRTHSGSWKLVQTLSPHVEPVVLEEYRNKSVIAHLENKDIIWVAGGMCGYLMYWMRRCEIDKHIENILDRGTVYIGSSAGSMVCSPTLTIGEEFPPDEEHGAGCIPGLGLVDFDIFPHYEESMKEMIQKRYNGKKLYLLKNGEAITIDDKGIQVLGTERIVYGNSTV